MSLMFVPDVRPCPPLPRMAPVRLPSHHHLPCFLLARAPCRTLDGPHAPLATHLALLQILVPSCQNVPSHGPLAVMVPLANQLKLPEL